MKSGLRLVLAATLCSFGGTVPAGVLLQPEPAPAWSVSEWINGDAGQLIEHRGKVVLIDFFQLWCPGCNSFSIPLFQRWEELYADREDVMIVSIHTVFEGHDLQTPELLRQFVQEKGIRHPVGIDAYLDPGDEVPITMNRYDTGGTPHVAIIDKRGILRFSHFGRFDPAPVEAFIERILEEKEEKGSKSQPRRNK